MGKELKEMERRMAEGKKNAVQLSCNDLENRLFESYKENLMEFFDWLLNYLYSFYYLSTFTLI